VIRHEGPGEHLGARGRRQFREARDERVPIDVVDEDAASLEATGRVAWQPLRAARRVRVTTACMCSPRASPCRRGWGLPCVSLRLTSYLG